MRARRAGESPRAWCWILPVALLAAWLPAQAEPPLGQCRVLDLEHRAADEVDRLQSVAGLTAWLQLDAELFACGSTEAMASLAELAPIVRDLGAVERRRLRLAHGLHRSELRALGVRTLAAGGRFAVVELAESRPAGAPDLPGLLPFVANQVLARRWTDGALEAQTAVAAGLVQELVDEVDPVRWFDDVTRLAGYNRYSNGPGIDAARRWIERQFEQMPGLEVESRAIEGQSGRTSNVIATLPGSDRPDDWYILGAHYDSTSEAPTVAAPGAEDNASGCAGVLEMARIFTANPPMATLVFICYAGEEQGLLGSLDHVDDLIAAGDAGKVRAMVSLDMIGFSADEQLGCLLESDTDGERWVEALAAAAQRFTPMRVATSVRPILSVCCSDHVSYALRGIPAALAIEDDWNLYPHYHRTSDRPEHLVPEMAEQILRMTVGAVALAAAVSELSGCVEAGDEPVTGAGVVLLQSGERKRRARSGPEGCFAFDGLAEGKRFKLRIRGPRLAPDATSVTACLGLRGEPLTDRPVELRQPGQPSRKSRSGPGGCVTLPAAPGQRFQLIARGPKTR